MNSIKYLHCLPEIYKQNTYTAMMEFSAEKIQDKIIFYEKE